MKLATKLCGLELGHPLMNAAGTCKTLEQVERFIRRPVSVVTVGTFTLEPRAGNQDLSYWEDSYSSVNAKRLPNPGASYYRSHLKRMHYMVHDARKWLKVSVAGFSPAEFAELAALAYQHSDFIELDFGSMTVWQESGQPRIVCFDPDLMAETLQAVFGAVPVSAWVGVKLAPFSDPTALREAAETVSGFPTSFVTASNTFPNGYVEGLGYGGVGGPGHKRIALGQVKQFRELLPDYVDVVGVGGIKYAGDVLEYLDVGATAVELATAFQKNEMIFDHLLSRLKEAAALREESAAEV